MDTAKVQLRRVTREIEERDEKGQPTGNMIVDPDSVVTGISYIDSDSPDQYSHLPLPESRTEFELSAAQAAAAITTGGFEVLPASKSTPENDGNTNANDTQELNLPE